MTYDPAYMATASCRSAITFIDGEQGHPRVPRLSDRAAGRAVELPRGRLPAGQRRAAHRRPARRVGRTRSRSTRSCTRTSRSSCRASATTPTRWGCCWRRSARSRPSIPRRARSRIDDDRYMQMIRLIAKMPTLAAFSYRHNRGMPYVYPDNDLSYPGNFLSMIYKMPSSSTSPIRGSSTRSTSCSSSTPTTSRTARPAPCAASAPRRSTPTRRSPPASPRSTARSTAAPTRRCCGCSTGSRTRRTSRTSSRASRTATRS